MTVESIKEEQWSRLRRVLKHMQKSKKPPLRMEVFLKQVRAYLFFHCSLLLQDKEGHFWILVKVEGQSHYVNENLEFFSGMFLDAEIIEYNQYTFLRSCRSYAFFELPALGRGLCFKAVEGVDYDQHKKALEDYLSNFSCPAEMFAKYHQEIRLNGFFFTTVQNCIWIELLRSCDNNVGELDGCPPSVRVEFCAPFPGKGVNPEIKRELLRINPSYVESWSEEEESLHECA